MSALVDRQTGPASPRSTFAAWPLVKEGHPRQRCLRKGDNVVRLAIRISPGYSGIVTVHAAVEAPQITLNVNDFSRVAVSGLRLSSGENHPALLTGGQSL